MGKGKLDGTKSNPAKGFKPVAYRTEPIMGMMEASMINRFWRLYRFCDFTEFRNKVRELIVTMEKIYPIPTQKNVP